MNLMDPADVEHGMEPSRSDALQLTIYEGNVEWLDPVTDAHTRD
ncbi:MAG: hypothetical protein Ct9H90mP25_0250 [Gammaproteobacteria bacterium]|nr:MAG: hypothetical protein Ct9H90mP25_0250 [Gammaproteobacteria bacterium]